MTDHGKVDVGERRAQAQIGLSLRAGWVAVFAFYVAGALLNGRHIYEELSLRPYGLARQISVQVTEPLRQVTTVLRLDYVRSAIESLREDE